MKAIPTILAIAFITWSVSACTSTGADDAAPDSGTSGGSGGSAGGKADTGNAGSAVGGAGGEQLDADLVEDSNPTIELPSSCAPSDIRFLCNPITNEGCEPGETCDYGLSEYFECTLIETTAGEGEPCDMHAGPFCHAGWTCDTPGPEDTAGVCHKHCCSSDDCVAPQTCETFDPEFGTLGICR